jgi:hypothetical protein
MGATWDIFSLVVATKRQQEFAYDICKMLQIPFVLEDSVETIEYYKRMFYKVKNSLMDWERALFKGYPSTRQKLNDMFWGKDMPEHNLRVLHTAKIKQILRERKEFRKQRKLTFSQRALKNGSKLLVVYPSGKTIVGRIVKDSEYALVEPSAPNTAAFLFDEKYSKIEQLHLSSIPHERIIHTKKGLEFIKEFQES